MTAYVGPHKWERPDGREVKREFRIEPSEAHPGMLDVGTYRYSDGECMGTAYLTDEDVQELVDALNEYLEEKRNG